MKVNYKPEFEAIHAGVHYADYAARRKALAVSPEVWRYLVMAADQHRDDTDPTHLMRVDLMKAMAPLASAKARNWEGWPGTWHFAEAALQVLKQRGWPPFGPAPGTAQPTASV